MQYSTALSDGLLALACLASTLWLRPAFRWRTVQRALLLGFGLPLSAAFCGMVRYGLDPDWSNWHRTFSQLSSYLGLPLLGMASVSLSRGQDWPRRTWTLLMVGLVLLNSASHWFDLQLTYRLLLGLLTLLLILYAGALHWRHVAPTLTAVSVVTLFLLAGLVVGTEGFIGPLRRVDLFHGLLSLAYPLLAWLLLRLQGCARAEIPVKTL
ncbi:hypothetical protein HNE05_14795 [Aquipseudomonas campi]|uniref:Uncharacterized protein n=1 Tax=Aquipseudomonas campi TaxID=2731681 RepID=A0A6M8FKR2_9GAMM|nr:hypothetical protein [Pseudomonas campi]QKE64560.1 hypothetical protein HNE05_14795 [Pseudomonas campi]